MYDNLRTLVHARFIASQDYPEVPNRILQGGDQRVHMSWVDDGGRESWAGGSQRRSSECIIGLAHRRQSRLWLGRATSARCLGARLHRTRHARVVQLRVAHFGVLFVGRFVG